jgi:pyruvate,water dikinase
MSKEGKKEVHVQGLVKWFSELSNKDIAVAGGKGASLAEMYNNKFPIPPGFMITAQAYEFFLDKASLKPKIAAILNEFNYEDTKLLEKKSKEVRKVIEDSQLPKELEEEILENYDILGTDKAALEGATPAALGILSRSRENIFVAVRSSATTEDLADASFAGQQESFLSVKGNKQLIESVKKCFSSLFTARAIYYRHKKGFSPTESKLAIVIQKMINSDKSGVIFSRNPVSNKDDIMIEAVFGLGEGIVSGMINPDNYIIEGNLSPFKILDTKVTEKKIAIVRNSSGENQTIKLNPEMSKRQVLSGYELKVLAEYSKQLERHYKKPQDIEFAISGRDIYIVQSRPITTSYKEDGKKEMKGDAILVGLGASPGIASGPVKIIYTLDDLSKIKKGDVLVTEMTNPDMVVDMQKASAIVTDEGGITSHASIVSREMGIPCVVGTGKATKMLKDDLVITVDGYGGKVFEGHGQEKAVEIKNILPTRTKIKVIVDLPDYAERAAKTGAKAVGLVRLEGVIAECGRHPYYFVKEKKTNEYAEVLFEGLTRIAEHFEEVWIRTSDIRSDEFQHLKGAPQIKEDNPMLGNHGVRFSLKHKDIMKAEVMAIKKLAHKHPKKIFGIMVPQLISLDELKQTKEIAKEVGIERGKSNVKIGIMVETPAAVQIINDLCEDGLDFISFGTNDLTQFTLAIDRNNEAIQDLYNEMNPAVLASLRYVIRRCKKYGTETSICGQAASKPEMAAFLVKEGIDSVSVNADAAYTISEVISKVESENPVSSITEKVKEVISAPIEAIKNLVNREELKLTVNQDIARNAKSADDIEEIILKELDESVKEDDTYVPGDKDKKAEKDIPSLNDAIPVESDLFEEKKD